MKQQLNWPDVNVSMAQCAMKILLLNYEFPPIGGGAGMATYCLSEALANFGNDVDVLTSGSLGDKPVEKSKELLFIERYLYTIYSSPSPK